MRMRDEQSGLSIAPRIEILANALQISNIFLLFLLDYVKSPFLEFFLSHMSEVFLVSIRKGARRAASSRRTGGRSRARGRAPRCCSNKQESLHKTACS